MVQIIWKQIGKTKSSDSRLLAVIMRNNCNILKQGRRIENGVYLGPIGTLTFEGKFSWKNRILAFIFERIRIKIGPLDPIKIGLGKKEAEEEPSNKDPFFIWFYVDEEAVAHGRSDGTAFWYRCHRIAS
ncbi:unnamed protein product [Eruca vesicaria subsp. sativa]|uniref:Uncharacterized protein n=1 Tax=Eruca vesicaria subsp. sativa TaxID=29727 RepID=A0ABC8M1H3_ERUVS|nr:unnamed protein product [Eruca vesicaria subsp. sativa]